MTKDIEFVESKPNTMKFNKLGDYIQGTLTEIGETTSPDSYGKLSMIYSVKADKGQFLGSHLNEDTGKYELDKDMTTINEGDEYVVFIDKYKKPLVGAMKKIVPGQKFLMKLVEIRKTDKGNPAKIIKAMPGRTPDGKPAMDESWAEQNNFGNFDE